MKRSILSSVFLLFMMSAGTAGAQVQYRIATSTATYQPVTGGTTLVEPSQNATICTTRSAVPLPFPFFFDGRIYSEIVVASNGYITFGTGSCDISNDAIPNTATPDRFIALFWDDLVHARVKTAVSGTAPNRSFTIQYSEAIRYPSTSGEGAVSGQITLYESGVGRFRVHYGPYVPNPTGTTLYNATSGFENEADDYGAYFLPCANNCAGSHFAAAEGAVFDVSVDLSTLGLESYLVREQASDYVPLAGGTAIPFANNDGAAALIDIGFPFEFYGRFVRRINVGVNGVAVFAEPCFENADCGSGTCGAQGVCVFGGIEPASSRIPSLAPPNFLVAPFWADLVLDPATSAVRSAVLGSAPNRELVIEWSNVGHSTPAGPTASRANFQVRLSEGTGTVRFHYGPFSSATDDVAWQSAAIGMEDAVGVAGHRPSIACAENRTCGAADLASLANTVVEFELPATVELTSDPGMISVTSTITQMPVGLTVPGAGLSVAVEIANIGRIDAGSFAVNAYLSNDADLDPADIPIGTTIVPGVLARRTAVATVSFTVPNVPADRYRVLIEIDALDEIDEVEETNNLVPSAVTLSIGEDLSLTTLTAPTTLGWDESFSATVRLRNDAAVAQTSALPVALYMLPTSAVPPGTDITGLTAIEVAQGVQSLGGVLVGMGTSSGSLAPNATVDLTLSANVGAIRTVGEHVLIAILDPSDAIDEFDETDNVQVRTVSLTGPDLATTFATDPPPLGFAGETFEISIEVHNLTNAIANDVGYAVILSANNEVSVPPDVVVDQGIIPVLGGSETIRLDLTVPIPTTLTSTNYYVAAISDSNFVFTEPNEFDNLIVTSAQIEIAPRAPELRMLDLATIPATGIGDLLPVARTIENRGPVAADVSYDVYLTADDVLDANDILLGTGSVQIAAYGRHSGTDHLPISGDVPAGTYHVAYVLDPDNAIAERFEDDNVGISADVVTIGDPYLHILTEILPVAYLGIPYAAELAASGGLGPIAWSVQGTLPPGLSLDASGAISGAATEEGIFTFRVLANDGRATVSKQLTIVAAGDDRDLAIVSRVLSSAFVGVPYDFPLIADGGARPYAWSALTPLPSGLELTGDGRIRGTPSQETSVAIDFQVEDAIGDIDVRPLVLRVLTSTTALRFADRSLSDGSVGDTYDERVEVVPGTGVPPFVYTIESGVLPDGLTLEDNRISGVLERAGDYRFTMRVTDAAGNYDVNTFLIFVSPRNAVQFATTSLPNGVKSVPYLEPNGDVARIRAFAAGSPVNVGILSGRLPPGLVMDAQGHIGGVPTSTGAYAFLVIAFDERRQSTRRAFGISIESPEKPSNPIEDDGGCGCSTTEHEGSSASAWLVLGILSLFCFRRKRALLAALMVLAPSIASAQQFQPLPGSGGYVLRTRNEPYVVRSGGTLVIDGDDDRITAVPLPFPITFYDEIYSTISISSNGFVTFQSTTDTGLTNYAIPSTSGAEALIAPCWDDLRRGRIRMLTEGVSPGRVLIIQYERSERYSSANSPEGAVNFQIRFLESSPRFEIHFGPFENLGGTTLFDATVGFENAAGTEGAYLFPCGNVCNGSDLNAHQNMVFELAFDRGADVSATSIAPELYGPIPARGEVLFLGVPFTLRAQLTSNTTMTLGPFRYAVDLLTPGSTRARLFTSSPITLGEFESVSIDPMLTISNTTATPGTYQLELVVDPDGELEDVAPTNNVALSEPFDLVPPAPDFRVLSVENATTTASFAHGSSVPIALEIANAGPVEASVEVRIVLSPDPSISGTDLELTSFDRVLGTSTVATVTIEATVAPSIPAGTYYLGAVADGSNAIDELVELNNTAIAATPIQIASPGDPVVVTTALPGGYVGTRYSVFLRASGGDGAYFWTLDPTTPNNALPPGLSLNPFTGEISGTPIVAWNDPFTIEVESGGRSARATLTIAIDEAGAGEFRIVPARLVPGVVGQSYPPPGSIARIATVNASGDVRFTLTSSAPPGIMFSADGHLSGRPTEAGDHMFDVTATDSAGNEASATLTLTVYEEGRLRIVLDPIPDAVILQPFEHQFTVVGQDRDRVQFSVEGSLPSGLRLTRTGSLVGTPVAIGIARFVITAEDLDSGLTDSKAFQMTVLQAPEFRIDPPSLPDAIVGEAYEGRLTAVAGTAPFTWRLMGTLPEGLNLDIISTPQGEEAVIRGVPARAELSAFIMDLEDRGGQLYEGVFSIMVREPPPPPPPPPTDEGCDCTSHRGEGGLGLLALLALLFVVTRGRPRVSSR